MSISKDFINVSGDEMIQEGNRYLSLAVMTYTSEFEWLGTAASDVADAELVQIGGQV